MGEIAEMMLEGCMCQVCGEYLGEGDGYPVTCEGCETLERKPAPVALNKAKARKAQRINRERQEATGKKCDCPECGKKFMWPSAVDQHRRDKHGVAGLTC